MVYEELATLLESSRGDSEIVVCGFVDVRGFSTFSESVESVEAALYIKSVYLRLMHDYFPDAGFIKPTGDGLLVIWPIEQTEKALKKRLANSVKTSLRVVSDFPKITKNDPLINFDVPQAVGIGLARGAACRLTGGDKVLDYSGGTLNLAARLMDMARPRGLVLDGAFGLELLPKALRDKFRRENVYLRSVAEAKARPVWVQIGAVTVPATAQRPLDRLSWKEVRRDYATLRELIAAGPLARFNLPSHPLVPKEIELRVHYGAHSGTRRQPGFTSNRKFTGSSWMTYEEVAGKPAVIVEYGKVAELLRSEGYKLGWGPFEVRIVYAE